MVLARALNKLNCFLTYPQLLPRCYVTRPAVDEAQFAQSIKRASTFARDGSGIIRPVGSEKYVHVIIPVFVEW